MSVYENSICEDSKYKESGAFKCGRSLATPPPGEEVVISGIAGIFPDSYDVGHFRDNLYSKTDMVCNDNRRWCTTHPEVPSRGGRIYNIEKFDAGYFGIHHRQADSLDPLCRLLFERVIEAIIDAGVNPAELESTKTGVYVGTCFSENENTWFRDSLKSNYFAITGNERSMVANRISYYLKLAGPSFILDTACSSSLYALEQAYKAIRTGNIDMAIVGGSNILLHPFVSLQFKRLGVLSSDGTCKVFDDCADGYSRSEAFAVLFLQKAKDSRRIYSQIVHVKTSCDGYKPQSITYPSGEAQKKLMQEFYEECGVDPTTLSFLEAHGTGTKVGDPEELQAIDEVFCKRRSSPLLVGSVKSNIGHTEPTSALCSIIKCIIGMENELIPPNIHFKTPRKDVEAFEKGRIKVVAENTPLQDDKGLMGVNSFGFGGGNAHTLLRWHKKTKTGHELPKDNLPRLICVSARIPSGPDMILNDICRRPLDVEHVKLFHQIFNKSIDYFYYRKFLIISKSGEVKRSPVTFCNDQKPLYLAFTGFGSSWSKLASHLYVLPLFAASIQRVYKILSTKGINIVEIVLNGTRSGKNPIFNEIVGTMTVQIALVDILKILEINPDSYFGYGFGEFICGYFQGSLTLEETVLSIYHIACTYQEFNKSKILEILNKVIGEPKERSSNWISGVTSKLASAEHFTNILSSGSSILNLETQLKKNSVILEIGNQDLKVSNKYYTALPLNPNSSFNDFLEILGNLYLSGHNLKLHRLYPNVQYPVSRGTPMISPLIKWEHSANRSTTYYKPHEVIKSAERSVTVHLQVDDWEFVEWHMIDGRILFPATAYLILVWETFGKITGMLTSDMQIVFENVKFLRATTIPRESKVEFTITVQRGSGAFEVVENGTVVVSGKIRSFKEGVKEQTLLPTPVGTDPSEAPLLTIKDIYKELRLRSYNYKGPFKGLKDCDNSITTGLVQWDGNWIWFMDKMLQMKILQTDTRSLFVPTGIERLSIDCKKHISYGQNLGENPWVPVYLYKELNMIKCGHIEIFGVSASPIARRKPRGEPVLEKYVFVPNEATLSIQNSVRVMTQIILENLPDYKVKTIEVIDDTSTKEPISSIIYDVLGDLPLVQPSISVFTKKDLKFPNVIVEDKKLITETDCTLVIGSNFLQTIMTLNQAFAATKPNGFILSRESLDFDFQCINFPGIDILAIHTLNTEKFFLSRRAVELKLPTVIDISNTNEEFVWLPILQKAVKNDPNVIVLAQNEPLSGILGLVNCIRREPGCTHVKAVFTFGETPVFDLNDPFYSKQIKKNFAINVYKDSKWGTYRHLLLNRDVVVEKEHCFCDATVRGDLSSLKWLEGPLTHETQPRPERDLVYVYYCALNFRDIMSASGRISADVIVKDRTQLEFVHGFEFTGKTKEGRRVMGIVSGALSTLLEADRCLLWTCPDIWSMEEAVTIPVVYSTVLEALFVRCKIKKGQSILIHSGSGGVGQAAIHLALHHGLIVYTTVGTKEKREFLKKHFPQLTDRHIGNSRDTSFEQMIYTETNGRGVDYVLNSLAEDKLLASVRCLAYGGNFLEIGKFDLASNNALRLKLLEKNASFHGIMVDSIFHLDPKSKLRINKLILEGIQNGSVKPIIRTIFKMEEIEKAFRFMAAGKHIGKVLIELRKEEKNRNALPTPKIFKGVPRFACNSEQVQIIIGGLGGFGLELADWLVVKGAKNLILTSRKGITTGYQAYRIKIWKNYGTIIHISTADVTTKEGCLQLIEEAKSLGTIQSIFNLAVVLKDGVFENQTVDNFRECLAPKAFATKYLDEITRQLCPQLRDFVIFSSVSCGRGNAGQTNYGMANSIMERICEKRKRDGYPATAIEWGAIGDVGLVAEMQEEHTEMEISGTLQQRISNCLQVLDTLLVQNDAIVCTMVVAEKRGGAGGADNIVDAVANILGLTDLKTVSLHVSLSELGMDSMTAVEIKQTIEREFEVFLTPHDIRNLTFARLQEIEEERATKDESLQKDKALAGFDMILRFMTDEATLRKTIIRLNSKVEPKGVAPNVIIFPGIEGAAKVLASLANNLRAHVHCLQFSNENQSETIRGMADYFFPLVENLVSKTEPFHIMGYSYGTTVALEVVALLESKGYTGTFISLDGAPYVLSILLKNHLDINSETLFQTGFLIQLMSLHMPTVEALKNKEKLFMCKSLEERLDMSLQLLPKEIPHSLGYLRNFVIALYKRLKALHGYTITYAKIKSNVKLFKPQNTSIRGLEDDYRLNQLCEKPVDVRVFKGNHVTFLENTEMSNAINSVLSSATHFSKETIVLDEAGRMQIPELEIKHI